MSKHIPGITFISAVQYLARACTNINSTRITRISCHGLPENMEVRMFTGESVFEFFPITAPVFTAKDSKLPINRASEIRSFFRDNIDSVWIVRMDSERKTKS